MRSTKGNASAFSLHRVAFALCGVSLLVTNHTSAAVSSTYNSTVHKIFEQWMAQYGTSYADVTEKQNRFEIFQQNLRQLEDFNTAGNRTYQLGLNQFSDLTLEEFRSRFGGGAISSAAPNFSGSAALYRIDGVSEVPDSVNWVAEGAANDIQSQGTCGCCWAFTAAAAIEAIVKIKTGVLKKLSEQQLLDCDTNSHGCQGGWFQSSFQYVLDNGGISSESSYPYLGQQGTCNTAVQPVAKISSWRNIPANDEGGLMKFVAQQPVAVYISALNPSFKNYRSGIYFGEDCPDKVDHTLLVVGYGTSDDGTKYWLLRNSWGPYWGENGYMRIAREVPDRPQGVCGLAMNPAIPNY